MKRIQLTHSQTIRPGEKPVDSIMTRQQFRHMSFNEIRRKAKALFPMYSRREINQLARDMFQRAWENRDKELVAKKISSNNPDGLGVAMRPLKSGLPQEDSRQ
jgi:hypothetical protein